LKQLFINLPVNDLEESMQFYFALGFTINPLFTDDDQKCMIWSNSIYLMLQSRQFSNSYLEKQKIDAREYQMPSFTLPVESFELVNVMMENGIKAGGKEPANTIKLDFMFLRSIEDLDGYIWGIMYLDQEIFKSKKNFNPSIS
jgi:predicted lactoylglutathione lyase